MREQGQPVGEAEVYRLRASALRARGAAARLDFTVIGPRGASRVETVAKALDLPIVVSEAFARVYGGHPRQPGRHAVRLRLGKLFRVGR